MKTRGTNNLKPIAQQKSLMELTAERIRDAIIEGELPLGSKVSEQSLADMLSISRSPVREALALLQIEGLISIQPKRGSFVFTPDAKVVDDLCDHRAVLEAACLKFAIERNPEMLVDGLQRGIDMMQHALDRGMPAKYSAGDMRFHRAIIEAAENASIAQVYTRTIGPLMAVRTQLFSTMNMHLDRSLEDHAQLLAACRKKDIATAQAVVTEHVHRLAEAYHSTEHSVTQGAEDLPKAAAH